ncbi:MAG: MBL fold metallo-hydrolase [Chloroflexota bacterium]|nr:MBL fold metallo-hydrolase [Chloroflexota bacterium]
MTEILFLGVGGAMAVFPASDHTALLVREGGTSILLDCGPAIMRQLEDAGIDPGELTHVFISHQHGDHTLGLPMLLLNRTLFWPDQGLFIIGVPAVLTAAWRLVSTAYPNLAERMKPIIHSVPLSIKTSELSLPGAESMKYRLARGNHTVPSFGIRLITTDGSIVVYSSDTGPKEDIADLARGADLLIHDSFYLVPPAENAAKHSDAATAASMAQEVGVRQLALVHRQDTGSTASQAYRIAAERYFARRVLVPAPGDMVTIAHNAS